MNCGIIKVFALEALNGSYLAICGRHIMFIEIKQHSTRTHTLLIAFYVAMVVVYACRNSHVYNKMVVNNNS